MTVSITEFIAARLDEDDAAAQAMPSGNIVDYLALDLKCYSGEREPGDTPEGANILWASIHVGDYGPKWPLLNDLRSRVLREVTAKRAILDLHRPEQLPARLICDECSDGYEVMEWAPDYPCETVRAIALVYSDHPDYDESWRA